MDTDPGIYLFVAGFSRCLERTLNMDVWFESFFDVLMWIYIFCSPTQKTPGPENLEDVQSESEAETETLPEVTEESLPSEHSDVSN